MPNFYDKSLKNNSIQSTSTHEFSVPRYGKENVYLNITSIKNDTTSEHISNTAFEAHLSPIDN